MAFDEPRGTVDKRAPARLHRQVTQVPFDVARAFDEARGIETPVPWTAERDQEVWSSLRARIAPVSMQNEREQLVLRRDSELMVGALAVGGD